MGTQARTKSSRLGYAFDDFAASHIRSPRRAGAGICAAILPSRPLYLRAAPRFSAQVVPAPSGRIGGGRHRQFVQQEAGGLVPDVDGLRTGAAAGRGDEVSHEPTE